MRILVLCHEYPPIGGGAAAVCFALSREFVLAGHEITVLTMGYNDLPEKEQSDGYMVLRIPCGRRRKEMSSPAEGLVWAQKAWKITKNLHLENPFDVTHAHFIMPAGIISRRLKKTFGVPFIITPHGSDVPGHNRQRLKLSHLLAKPWWGIICKQADWVVSPSSNLLKLIEKRTTKIKAKTIPNGFEPDKFKPLNKEKRILMCGRLVHGKGFQYFLEAIKDLDLDGWKVDVVGDGPLYETLSSLSSLCKIPVTMHGWLDSNDSKLAELYGRSMIFVHPSEWENFPIAVLEAMGSGCAIITTDIAGNREAIGDAGYLIKAGDITTLRQATVELVKNTKRCSNLGRRARERALSLFDWKIASKAYLDLFESLPFSN